jgi:hypothetical protein
MLKSACSTTALLAFTVSLTSPVWAAGCATPGDAAALKTAVMQQELMVAALQCHEAGAYNRFVLTYRDELQASDATLKSFFVRRGGEHGEAGYDTFKTKAANLSALEQARDAHAFCADAHALYAAAMNNHGSLFSFVSTLPADIGNVCLESKPMPVLARADVKPAPVPVRVAEARPADDAVGVPAHSQPAFPYRHEDRVNEAPPVQVAQRAEERETAHDEDEETRSSYANNYQEEAPPPPRPRYYQVRNRSYQDDYYAPRSYGPPPDWRQAQDYPAPSYRWYPQDGYYGR